LKQEITIAIGMNKERRGPMNGAPRLCYRMPREVCPPAARLRPRSFILTRLFAAFLLAIFLSAFFAASAEPSKRQSSGLPTLTTAQSVHDLTHAQAEKQYPVHLRAVCVVCYPGWYGFFVNDGESGVYVQTRNHALLTDAIHPGTVLDIYGITSPGEFAPIVDQSSLRILGDRPLPPARPVSLDHLSTGVEDGQFISFEGTVRSAKIRESLLELVVASGRWQVEVMTTPDGRDIGRLVDSRVQVRGAGAPIFNQRSQLIGVSVYAPNLDNIRILQSAPANPFSLPLTQVKSVFAYVPGASPDHMVRIRGVVAARWAQTVYINDGIQGASILGRDIIGTLNPGDVVDAVGYPALGDPEHTIEDAIFRQVGRAPVQEPKTVTAKQALSGDFAEDVVRLRGRLIEQQKSADQITLLVDSEGTVFSAILPGDLKDEAFAGLRDGSQIQLAGICVISETQASRHFRLPKAFQILLRSPDDVVLLQEPTWWTPGHASVVLALVLAVTLVVFGWVVALRKRVAQQTSLLRESEERFRHMALHDALTGLATRVLFQDRLDVALESARRRRTGLALLMVDLDSFKQVNDAHGHQAGDKVLEVTAERALQSVRMGDTVARIGGDEFVVLLSDLTDLQAAEKIAANIVEAMTVPIHFAGTEIAVSASVGVCAAMGGELDADALMKHADAALYQAKSRGRGRFEVFTPGMNQTQTATSADRIGPRIVSP
jgi:diguanylate cyclase (GGDEF)-like protein